MVRVPHPAEVPRAPVRIALERWPIWLAASVWLVASLGLVAIAERTRPVSWFVVNQLQFDYEHEFVRRGLPGEVLRVLGLARMPKTAYWLGWAVAAALGAASWAFFRRMAVTPVQATPVRTSPISTSTAPLMLAFLCSPAAFLQTGYDFGRLDAALVALTMVMLLTMENGFEAMLLDVVLVVTATLSHEIFVVTSAPFLVAAFLLVAASRPELRARLVARAVVITVASGVVGLVVMRLGNVDTFTFDQFKTMLANRGRLGGGDPTAIAVAFRTLEQSMAYAASRYVTKPMAPMLGAAALAAVTWGAAWWALRRHSALADATEAGATGRAHALAPTLLLLVAALTPLALLPVGHDYGRWVALSMANTLMAVAVVSHATGRPPRPGVAWLALLAVAGPLGADVVLPWWM